MGAWKLFGTGLALLLAVGLTGCTNANPVQVSAISATVKKLDLKSLGGAVCDGVYEPPAGGTVTYERTIAVHGAGQVSELVERLKQGGFKLDVKGTENSKEYTYLDGPHQIRATLLSKVRTSPGERFHLDDAHICTVPKVGVTILGLAPSGG
jgi:hypothetical protein